MKHSSMDIPVARIIEVLGGKLLQGDSAVLCRSVSTDSRTMPEGALFIPLRGTSYDGHDYLDEAVKKGAAAVLMNHEERGRVENLPAAVPVIGVKDTLEALGDLARWWRNQFSLPVIAVTGSTGKTTTKEMIALVAGKSFRVLKNDGNLNNLIGLPMTLLQLRKGHGAAVLEAASNHPGEIARLGDIASPEVAVITNIGPAHLEGFGSIEGVREEKGSIFSSLGREGIAVINRDDDNIRILEDRWRGKSISFGINSRATVKAERLFRRSDMSVSFTLKIGRMSKGIDMSTPGMHNIYNALAAAASAWAIGVPFEEICEGLTNFQQIPGRMTITRLESGITLIDDSYNANPASMKAALETLVLAKESGYGIVIFGDMLEMGDQAEEKHLEVGALMAAAADMIFLTGDHAEVVAEGARRAGMDTEAIHLLTEPGEVVKHVRNLERRDLWVLVKGSRYMEMERFCEAFKRDQEEAS